MIGSKMIQTRRKPAMSVGSKIASVCIYGFIAIVAFTCVLPFIHVFAKSVSADSAVIANKVFLWPQGFDMVAYQKVLADASIIRSFFVSVLTTVLFTALGMFITLCAAYPLSRRDLIARKGFTVFFMITMYFSGGMIPEYLLVDSLGLLDTLGAMILPLAFSAYNLLIMKTSLQASIPESLIEAAHMEGASEFKILTKIIIPLSKPVMATLILFYAVGRWNAFSDALFYIKRNIDIRPLQLKLYYLVVASTESISETVGTVRQHTNPELLKAATIILATLPILCVYPFVQNYFVQGTMIGAVKE